MQANLLAASLINFFVGIVETFLGLRFALKLFGANPANGFVDWIYDMSSGLLDPFRSIFPTRVFDNDFVFEFSTLFAMIIYALVGMFALMLVDTLAPKTTKPSKK